jgi:hypothetical protein
VMIRVLDTERICYSSETINDILANYL